MIISISVAHTHGRQGAGKQIGVERWYEWPWSRDFSRMLQEELLGRDHHVTLFDTPGKRADERHFKASRPYDLLIECHLNASEDENVNYGLALHGDSGASERAAIALSLALSDVLKGARIASPRHYSKGFPRAQWLLDQGDPAVILEACFVTNEVARERIFQPAVMRSLARACAERLSAL